ncbi:MAG TPA: peptidoglycan DD-metalloendopeptidase family protein [Candidatus Eubacterium faecigallinarum]|nr:peptidoglycan DD-metalloendopeptidase family protein [Candidatus Eubacterium faecigallinarum]
MKIKLLSLFMAVILVTGTFANTIAFAEEKEGTVPETTTETTTAASSENTTEKEDGISKEEAQKTLEDQQAELQKNLEEAEKKLAQLEKNSKGTAEYIDTLDQKIGYINEQLTILEEQNISIQADIDELMPTIEKNEQELDKLSKELDKTKEELEQLEEKFQSVYDAYCIRLRVMYISGDFNILTALMTCKDISSLLTRYEMIRSVSKSDAELMQEVQEQTEQIISKKDGLDEQAAKYESTKATLDSQKESLQTKQKTIENNSEQIAAKKATLATDRAESDRMLAELTAKNKQYTEFRNEDSELIEAVENEIQALISGLKSPEEVTTAVSSGKHESSAPIITDSDVYSKSNAVLNMTYPIPGHTSISAGYPNYSSGQYHGGIDFPCPTGSKVVAAQKGIVITVKRLDYSYGYYVMIYHGTDAKGRSVVTLYAHNSSILVSVGDTVKKGQQIAKSGSTGNSTGPHCHFELRFDGTRVNPKNYLG